MKKEVQLINDNLISSLHQRAIENERKRMNFDLRTTPNDHSQRMLNAMEIGSDIPIHRHLNTTETIICIEGSLDMIFYVELPNMDAGGPVLKDNETAAIKPCFAEIARFHLCPAKKIYGIQIPLGVWHSVEVHEPSVVFEAKDGAYRK